MIEDVLGYDYNSGGLNNQKLALLGLFLEARKRAAHVRLPRFFNLDHVKGPRVMTPVLQVYDPELLRLFAARWGLSIVGEAEDGSPGVGDSWPYFGAGATHIAAMTAAGKMTPDDIACDFCRSLVPLICYSADYTRLQQVVFNRLQVQIVLQMRIETDWQRFSAITLKPTVGNSEDYLPSYRSILGKLRQTFHHDRLAVYVVCDETALTDSLDEIRDVARHEFDLRLIWKSDILGTDFVANHSALDRSLVDFAMTAEPPHFIGLTRSTFSNMASFHRYSVTRADVRGHYIYNLPGTQLHERHDNGAHAFASAAIVPRQTG